MSVHGCLHERSMHLVGLVLLVGAGLEQEAHHLQMALVAGQGESRLLELVRVGVDTGAVAQEDLERSKGYVKLTWVLMFVHVAIMFI